jgi:hypothetical protein
MAPTPHRPDPRRSTRDTPNRLPECCLAHDGAHVHGCARPRTGTGATHPGICLTVAGQS